MGEEMTNLDTILSDPSYEMEGGMTREDMKEAIKSLFLELVDGDPNDRVYADTTNVMDWSKGYNQAKDELRQKIEEL